MKALQFSGGKDSLALLYYMEPHWDDLTVVWANAGAAFPETLEMMQFVRRMVPKFLEINSRQNIPEMGFPADVVPSSATLAGRIGARSTGTLFQSKHDCCRHALWEPMYRAMKEHGFTTVYRGQKAADHLRSPLMSGTKVDGITYIYPLESWTDDDVKEYLGDRLPAYYQIKNSGLDCWNCTAYLDDGKIAYLKANHPGPYEFVSGILKNLQSEIDRDLQALKVING